MTRTPAEPLADGEMIERVARALARSDGVPDDAPVGDYLRNAKDVIAALSSYNPNDRLREALEEAVAYIRWLADGDSDTIVHAGTLRAKADKLDAALSHKD